MVNATQPSSSGVASSSKSVAETNEASTSATALLRSLKSAQSSHSERISTARQALQESKIPRAAELVRQWILDEWLVPSKGTTVPSVIQPEYHALFAEVNGASASPPFAVLGRCLTELEKHRTPVSAAPVASLRNMISTHVQMSTYGRWVELWAGLVAWLASPAVIDGIEGGDVQAVKDLSDAVFQHIMESSDIVQAESSSTALLVKSITHLANLLVRQPDIAEHLTTSYAEVLRSLPSDSLDQFLLPCLSSSHGPIAQFLPLLLSSLASTRARLRYTIFTQPTSSKVAYETHIAQSLHEALYRDFSQAMAYLDGVALLGGIGAGEVWEARYGCWDELRRLDVRVEGVERWRSLVVEAARGARAVLAGTDEVAIRTCLKLLACLSVLDYSAAGISDSVVQLCLQPTYLDSPEGADLLLALLHHHRLIRSPVAYIELLCRCISTPDSTPSSSSSSSNISPALLGAITDLITHTGETLTCWRVLSAASTDLLSGGSTSEEALLTFANLLAALVVAGCPGEILADLRGIWVVRAEDMPVRAKKAGKGKSKSATGDARLSAVLTVQSALRCEVGEEIIGSLKGVVVDRSASETLDVALCRFLLATPTEQLGDASLINELSHRLSGAASAPYWSLLSSSVMRRLELLATEDQLQSLSQAIIAHTPFSRYLWTSTSFWELPRLSSILLRLILSSDPSDPSIGYAVPSALQSAELAVRYVQKAGGEGYEVRKVGMWLEQVNVEALVGVPAEVILGAILDAGKRELGKVIVLRLLQSSSTKIPEVTLELVQKLREHVESGKPKFDICSAMMDIICLFTSRKWASVPTKTQVDLSVVAAACSKSLTKALGKSPVADKIESKGQLWLDLHAFSVWTGETNKLAPFPDTLLQSMFTSISTPPALTLRLVAARADSTDTLIAIYTHLRSVSTADTVSIDNAISAIIQSAAPGDYASLWQSARHPSAFGGLLALLISTTREGSGKVVRGHLGPILASVQAGGDAEVLSSLWRHRAILFDEGQAIDAWVTFSGIFLSSLLPSTASSLLDAATSFAQQRADLLPSTSSSITPAICSIFTYLRGRTDAPLAQKVARFLDSLGRSAGQSGQASVKRKADNRDNTRQALTRAMARHVPVILISYARASTDPTRNISAASRRIIDPSLAELCMSTDAATGKAFDSTGLPYGLGEGLAGEAESAVWAQIWRSWKKKRYTGQG